MFMARNYYHRAMTDQEAEQSASTPIMKGPAKQQGQSDFSIALNGRRQKKDAPNPPPGYTMTTTQATAPLTAPQDFFGILSAWVTHNWFRNCQTEKYYTNQNSKANVKVHFTFILGSP